MDYKKALQQYIEATNTHDFNNVKKVLHENAIFLFTENMYNDARNPKLF
ncbi:hypothetical protein PthBH41_18600 [Parageobacillus thermoglucosidasius]|nr:hypothetical protein PthBH41_18600 [Parageobacillus thermoglucosidasius]